MGVVMLTVSTCGAVAQATTKPSLTAPVAPAAAKGLSLQTLNPTTQPDPFPAVNKKYFTADLPTVATVDSYLKAVLGYDANRIWRVMAIQKTAAAGVTKVTAMISERSPNAKVQTAIFFVMPDGKHLVADGSGVQPFGAAPYGETREILQSRADGPYRGSAAKELMLVEFADLQCPHCKDAEVTMKRLAEDFPKARVVYQSFPLVEIHPFAFSAAAYGLCVAKKSNEAFFTYAEAVYATQGALTTDTGVQTLKDAATKAGLDAEATATCAETPAVIAAVNASANLAVDLGVDSTPMLSVNGRLLPLTTLPYETLKQLIVFQAGLDGAQAAAGH